MKDFVRVKKKYYFIEPGYAVDITNTLLSFKFKF
jgi:hypothetical protein